MRLLALLAVVAAPAVLAQRPSPPAEGPRLGCDAPVFEFGAVDNEETLDHTFTLRNDGSAPVEISRVIACCGASADLSRPVLAPGATATLRIRLRLQYRSGEQRKRFYVRSNDPGNPLFELQFHGTAVARVDVRPPSAVFGMLARDAREERTIEVTCDTGIVFTVTNVAAPSRFVETEYRRLSDALHEVRVRTVPPLSMGVLQGSVRLSTDHPKYREIEIPVFGRISLDIMAIPPEIVVARSEGRTSPLTSQALVRSRTRTPFRILSAEAPESGIEVTWRPAEGGGFRIDVRNLIPLDDLNGKPIILRTDHEKAREVAIPIRLVTLPQE